MRIDNTKRPAPAAGVRSYQKAENTAGSAAALRAADAASVLGIPQGELTPKVQEAISQLMAEVDTLRQDLDQSMSRIEYLEQFADQDSLAPVANRRAFVRELSRNLSYAERYGTLSSVIYLDLSGLKQLNDSKGHAAGDATLMHVAAALTENLRESDMLGRLGGDEFGVILSHTDAAQALEKGRQLAHAIMAKPVDYEGAKITVTASYGITTFKPGDSAQEAMEAADRAMYEQKNALKSAVKPTPKPGANPGDKPGTG